MNTQLRQLTLCSFFSLFWFWSFLATAAAPPQQMVSPLLEESKESIFDRLNHREVLEITLETDLGSLINDRKREEYQPAVFSYEDEKGQEQKWEIKVRPRGKYRRRICDFPPVKIKFSKKDLEAKGLLPFNKYKLVTHCMDNKSLSKDLVMKEYLAYKLYNELTENSFKVQLVKVTYFDSNGDFGKIKRWGILLENTDELAARIGGKECKCVGLKPEDYYPSLEKIHSVFQYMIGNEDWSLETNRNVKLIRVQKNGKVIPVPYDFDFSGLVDAPYAIPNSNHKLMSITDRAFLGNTCDSRELYATCSYFRSKKKALIKTVKNFKLLNKVVREEVMEYLQSFFEIIKDPEATETLFVKK